MLASVKVLHSHNRPAFYYLKRSLVDVVFLVRMFDDFHYSKVGAPLGLLIAIVSVASHLSEWVKQDSFIPFTAVSKQLDTWTAEWRSSLLQVRTGGSIALNDARMDLYLKNLETRFLMTDHLPNVATIDRENQHFVHSFLARLHHFSAFSGSVYGNADSMLEKGIKDAVIKIFASTAGSALAFMYLELDGSFGQNAKMAETIKNELAAGI